MTVNFSNTSIAFKHLSDRALRHSIGVYQLINSVVGNLAVSVLEKSNYPLRLPFVKPFIRNTIFHQFCGGEKLPQVKKVVDSLEALNTKVILDYGGEAASERLDYSRTEQQLTEAITFAADNPSVFGISIKITGLTPVTLLEKLSASSALIEDEQQEYNSLMSRLHRLCGEAFKREVVILIDAEESWIQFAIDDIAWELMKRYNSKKPIIYNTYQMYRSDRLSLLQKSVAEAKVEKFILGAKIVRGAYMEKERKRAAQQGYPSPIHESKAATDKDFNSAVQIAFEEIENMATCVATHNEHSSYAMLQLLHNSNKVSHPHISFCQLYGMSDNITFNIASEGFKAVKYVPFGTIEEVIPYLVRRARENKSVSNDMGKEYQTLKKEWKRRKTQSQTMEQFSNA